MIENTSFFGDVMVNFRESDSSKIDLLQVENFYTDRFNYSVTFVVFHLLYLIFGGQQLM